jgi:hypothetical protein
MSRAVCGALAQQAVQETLLRVVQDTEEIQQRALELFQTTWWSREPLDVLRKNVELFYRRSDFPLVRKEAEWLLFGGD